MNDNNRIYTDMNEILYNVDMSSGIFFTKHTHSPLIQRIK